MKKNLLAVGIACLTLFVVSLPAHAQFRGGRGMGSFGGYGGYNNGYGYGITNGSGYGYGMNNGFGVNNGYGMNNGWNNGYGWTTPYYGANYGGMPQNFAPSYAATNPGLNQNQSFYSGPGANSATIRVTLPDPNAQVWFDGQQTRQQGTQRMFHTPPLGQGNHSYTIRATWNDNGKQVTRDQQVQVAAGREAMVNFSDAQGQNQNPAPVQNQGQAAPPAPQQNQPAPPANPPRTDNPTPR